MVSAMMIIGAVTHIWLAEALATPSVNEVIEDVLKATAPHQGFTAAVIQTIEKEGQPPIKSQFLADWSPDRSFVIQRNSVKVLSPEQDKDNPRPDIQMGVDIAKYLRSMQAWNDVKIVSDPQNGKPFWKISGQDPRGSACQLWVDAERSCVTQLFLSIQGRRLAEASFEYRRVNDKYWLSSKIIVKQVAENTRIIQEFSDYVLTRP